MSHGLFDESLDGPPAWKGRIPARDSGAGCFRALAYLGGAALGAIGLPLLVFIDVATHPGSGDDVFPATWLIITVALAIVGGVVGLFLALVAHALAILRRIVRRRNRPAGARGARP